MRLINVKTYELEYFHDSSLVDYAILSHRWEEDEVLFEHINAKCDPRPIFDLKGFYKIQKCCHQAIQAGLRYVWVDTCCIDKNSSAELQEAINSMFKWYQQAEVCYAFLSDVFDDRSLSIGESQWFERGWTLQELLAPVEVYFFDARWKSLGTRRSLCVDIECRTGIPVGILSTKFDNRYSKRPCVAEIMSWASNRLTTRIEDRAYSLLGLFGVAMPMLYGEGEKAFERLQEEMLKCSDDQTIFAWAPVETNTPGLLARSPDSFPRQSQLCCFLNTSMVQRRKSHAVTNEGVSLEMPLANVYPGIYLGLLNLEVKLSHTFSEIVQESNEHIDTLHAGLLAGWQPNERSSVFMAIFLKRVDNEGRFARISHKAVRPHLLHSHQRSDLVLWTFGIYTFETSPAKYRQITVLRELRSGEVAVYRDTENFGFQLNPNEYHKNWKPAIKKKLIDVQTTGKFDVETGSMVFRFWGDTISFNVFSPKPHFFNSQLCQIKIGFDFDFTPVMLFSTSRKNNATLWSVHLSRCENLSELSSARLKVFRADGCTWGHHSADLLAIRMKSSWSAPESGMFAIIDVPQAVGPAMCRLILSMSRKSISEPWVVNIFRHNIVE